MPGRPGRPGTGSGVVGHFAVRGEVETFALGFLGRTQADDHVDNLVQDRRDDAAPDDGDDDSNELDPDLAADA